MKITNLVIRDLHGCYNYSVDFNEDVTFIYGTNGCGKTTILDITAAIITGSIYKLFSYKFSQIDLFYSNAKKSSIKMKVSISYSSDNLLNIDFNDKKDSIALIREATSIIRDTSETRYYIEMEKLYFSRYPILREIREIFNYVYLPLNRSSSVFASGMNEHDEYLFSRRHVRLYDEDDFTNKLSPPDNSMLFVESLVMSKFHEINAKINAINDNFRNDIFKSFLSEFRDINFSDVMKEIANDSLSDINETRTNFVKIIKNIDLWSDEHGEQINRFFEEIIKAHTEYSMREEEDNEYDNDNGVPTTLVFGYTKILQIKEILNLANKMELNKNRVQKPVETFINTINEFVQFSDDTKKINIYKNGKIYFTNQYSHKPISINNLSSGEKQLVTFFACLLFGVNPNKTGIFIVDEPELSLHLSWQKIFVEKVLSINSSVQLVFATHSPEIISKYRDKTFKLIKGINKQKRSNWNNGVKWRISLFRFWKT